MKESLWTYYIIMLLENRDDGGNVSDNIVKGIVSVI